jgi:hypothetical protein
VLLLSLAATALPGCARDGQGVGLPRDLGIGAARASGAEPGATVAPVAPASARFV